MSFKYLKHLFIKIFLKQLVSRLKEQPFKIDVKGYKILRKRLLSNIYDDFE